MKTKTKHHLGVLACALLGLCSCTSDVLLDISPQEGAARERPYPLTARSNVIIREGGGITAQADIAASKVNEKELLAFLGDRKGRLVAYSGSGGEFDLVGEKTVLAYSHKEAGIGWNYFVGNNEGGGWNIERKDAFASLRITFRNRMEELCIDIAGMRLMNVAQAGKLVIDEQGRGQWSGLCAYAPLDISIGAFTLEPGEENSLEGGEIIPQHLEAWEATHLPYSVKEAHILLDCHIYYPEEGSYGTVWGGEEGEARTLAIPLELTLKEGGENTLEVILEDGCLWYDISGERPKPALNAVTFDAGVDGWNEQESEIQT